MPNELGAGNAFMEMRLTGDTELQGLISCPIQADFVDEPAPGIEMYPLVIFSMASAGPDAMGMGAERVLTDPLYLVLAIGHDGYGEIGPLCDRIDAALHQAQATVNVGGIEYDVCCKRERPVQPPSGLENGVRFVRRGGYYRLEIQQI